MTDFHLSTHANWHPDTLVFRRQQSQRMRDAEWERRERLPEPWWKLIVFGGVPGGLLLASIIFWSGILS
jgi:hypothetical protein